MVPQSTRNPILHLLPFFGITYDFFVRFVREYRGYMTYMMQNSQSTRQRLEQMKLSIMQSPEGFPPGSSIHSNAMASPH